MKKILIVFLVLFVIAFFVRDNVNDFFTGRVVLGDERKGMISQDLGDIFVYFCPKDNCEEILLREIEDADRVDCAFFDLNLDSLIEAIRMREHRLIVDDRNFDKFRMNFARKDGKQGLMHNKFCILDGSRVITGSMNPTENGVSRSNNNLVLIESKTLAENYLDEFNEMWEGSFGKGDSVKNPKVMFNGFLIENYFCPEDCVSKLSSTDFSRDGGLNKLIHLVEYSKESIKIAAFSFTSDRLRDALIKAHYYGIDVKIVIEKRNRNTLGSEYEVLKNAGIDIRLDENKGNMHHKFMVIDDEIVEFGSYNYGRNANDRNDENMLIIYDLEVARKFSEEFDRIYENSSKGS